MMNLIGKILVHTHLVVCMLAFGWAASMYFDIVDWGWKTPRKELDVLIPSEIDKRIVQQKEEYRRRDGAYVDVKEAWSRVREAEKYFVQNALWYDKEMARLLADANEIEVSPIEIIDGFPKLETVGSPLGRPMYHKDRLKDIEKSYRAYLQDLKKIHEKAQIVDKELVSWQEKQKENTELITGTIEKGRQKPGLFDLRQREIEAQSGFLDEIRYLEPREIDFRKEAEIYRERRELLEQDLSSRVRLLKK